MRQPKTTAHGPLLGARMALRYAKPWQQVAIVAVVIGAGIALIVVGDLRGVALVVFGLIFAKLFFPRHRPTRRVPQDDKCPVQDDPGP
jgi:hypothetical protein